MLQVSIVAFLCSTRHTRRFFIACAVRENDTSIVLRSVEDLLVIQHWLRPCQYINCN